MRKTLQSVLKMKNIKIYNQPETKINKKIFYTNKKDIKTVKVMY